MGIVLAGGQGTRFGDPLKCLKPVCGVPMLLRVAAALQPHVDKLMVATTKGHGPIAWLAETWGMGVVYTEGRGYERDVKQLAELAPAVIAACDLPFLTPSHVRRIMSGDVMTTGLSEGEPVGLTYLPISDLDEWTTAELGPLVNVNSREDWLRSESLCSRPAYPLLVDPNTLLAHEDVEGEVEIGEYLRPIAVDAWSCVVLDGHHRLAYAKRHGIALPVVPMSYSALDVYAKDGAPISKLEVLSAAARGAVMGVRATRHFYRGIHVSKLNHASVKISEIAGRRPLVCSPI